MDILTQAMPTLKLKNFGLGRKKAHDIMDDCESIHSSQTPIDLTSSEGVNSPETSDAEVIHVSSRESRNKTSDRQKCTEQPKFSHIRHRSNNHHRREDYNTSRSDLPTVIDHDSDDDSDDGEEDIYARFAAAGAVVPSKTPRTVSPTSPTPASSSQSTKQRSSTKSSFSKEKEGSHRQSRSSKQSADDRERDNHAPTSSRSRESKRRPSMLGNATLKSPSSAGKEKDYGYGNEDSQPSSHRRDGPSSSSRSRESKRRPSMLGTATAPTKCTDSNDSSYGKEEQASSHLRNPPSTSRSHRESKRRPSMLGTATAPAPVPVPSTSTDKEYGYGNDEPQQSSHRRDGATSLSRSRESKRRPSMLGTAVAPTSNSDSTDYGYGNEEPQPSSHRRERRPSMITSPSTPYEEQQKGSRSSSPTSPNVVARGTRARQQRRMSASALPASHVGRAFEEVYFAPPPGAAGLDDSVKKKKKKKKPEDESSKPDGSAVNRSKAQRRISLNCAPVTSTTSDYAESYSEHRRPTSASSGEPKRGVQRNPSLKPAISVYDSNDTNPVAAPKKKSTSSSPTSAMADVA